MPLLFSYGTLQERDVQLETFGRELHGSRDELRGVALTEVAIADPAVRASTGRESYDNIAFIGDDDSRIGGTLFEVTDVELARSDAYEASEDYRRIEVTLISGTRAWVYFHPSTEPNPDRTLHAVLSEHALAAAPSRLATEFCLAALALAVAMWVQPRGWSAIAAAATCAIAYVLWSLAERRLRTGREPASRAGAVALRSGQNAVAILGVGAFVALLFIVLGVGLGTIIS